MITVTEKPAAQYTGDMLVYFVKQNKKKTPVCPDREIQKTLTRAYNAGDFKAKKGQTLLFYPETSGRKSAGKNNAVKRVLIVGLGGKEINEETIRSVAGTVAGKGLHTKSSDIMLVVPELSGLSPRKIAESLTVGLLLGSYQFKKYKQANGDDENNDEEKATPFEKVRFSTEHAKTVRQGVRDATAIAEAVHAARDMCNEPGNQWTPAHFADYARNLARTYKLNLKILEKEHMEKISMGGILAVNQGSGKPAKLISLHYKCPKKNAETLMIVGKGLTFDSGGISLKPGAGMQEMKYDMSGGAVALAVMQAVGELKPKNLNVVAVVPATENLPGPDALKPGDIITHHNGKTVEVINTDAEGRLILADALSFGIQKYKPHTVIDIATLTGAIVVGLGHHRTGLFANDDKLADTILDAGEQCGEPFWRLPLDKEYRKHLKSRVADLKNIGGRAGGAITAACFLQEFIGKKVKWAHMDIAGTAFGFTEKSYVPKGASGIGVRTIVEVIRNWKD